MVFVEIPRRSAKEKRPVSLEMIQRSQDTKVNI